MASNNKETISEIAGDTKVENKTSKPEQRKEYKGIVDISLVLNGNDKSSMADGSGTTKDTVVVLLSS